MTRHCPPTPRTPRHRGPALGGFALLLAATLGLPVQAELNTPFQADSAPLISETERQDLSSRIDALKEKAARLRQENENRFLTGKAACYRKFFVNACIDDVSQEKNQGERQAREIDGEARVLEKELRERETATRLTHRQEEAPIKAAERAEEAARNLESIEATQKALAERWAEQNRKRAEGQAAAAREAREAPVKQAEKQKERNETASEARERSQAAQTAETEVRQAVERRDLRVEEKRRKREADERQRAADRAAAEKAGILPAPR